MGQLRRQLVMWGAIATTTAVLPGLALADNVSPDHGGGRHGRGHQHDDAKLSVAGRAFSKGDKNSYGLQIRGRSGEQPTDAGGLVRFGHKGEDGMEGLVGRITCLSKDQAGVVTATGTIRRSGKRDKKDMKAPGTEAVTTSDDAFLDEIVPWDSDELTELEVHGRDGRRGDRRGGGELAGKDFAFTINIPGKPQTFSTPTIGEKGTLAACSGGGEAVKVTRGKFRAHEAGEKADGDRKGRRGWFR